MSKNVKILQNVIHKAAVLKKGAVHKLPDDEADLLIKGEHAEEFKGKPPKATPPAGITDAPGAGTGEGADKTKTT